MPSNGLKYWILLFFAAGLGCQAGARSVVAQSPKETPSAACGGACSETTLDSSPGSGALPLSTAPLQAGRAGEADVVVGQDAAPMKHGADIVGAEDRSAADRALDSGRQPAALLDFFGVRPGLRVAELAAGGGYTAELLARAVGPQGKVWGQNSPFILQRFAQQPWSERLTKPVMANVIRVDSEFDAPLPTDVRDLDLVLNVLFYHDTVWMRTDRPAMNRAVFAALAPGGIYGIVDHSARLGAGLTEVESLHRIEESVVRTEVEAAGFVLDGEANFLRNSDDPKDWNASPRSAAERRGQSDRFVLRFRKPK